jgi:hypothetical protein
MKPVFSFCVALLALTLCIRWAGVDAAQAPVADIGNRLELFVDRQLVESTRGVTFELQRPVAAEKVLAFDKPWEGAFAGVLHGHQGWRGLSFVLSRLADGESRRQRERDDLLRRIARRHQLDETCAGLV